MQPYLFEVEHPLYVDVEVSYGGDWISVNEDHYKLHADSFSSSAKNYRRITASSPIVDGNFLLHSAKDMVTEEIKIWVRGADHADVFEHVDALERLFDQMSYRLRLTRGNYRETWICQQTDSFVVEAGHVYTHNTMALVSARVPRYPNVTTERIES